jgi:hypothetical protein
MAMIGAQRPIAVIGDGQLRVHDRPFGARRADRPVLEMTFGAFGQSGHWGRQVDCLLAVIRLCL